MLLDNEMLVWTMKNIVQWYEKINQTIYTAVYEILVYTYFYMATI